ncbi:hypothetical protein DFH11DRAFT_1044396 [Phellopilus nigrolimitatus]|nr:hypothetical protein DFH11DRAFT_1044396 [Phellopilus nigrolimitatus]
MKLQFWVACALLSWPFTPLRPPLRRRYPSPVQVIYHPHDSHRHDDDTEDVDDVEHEHRYEHDDLDDADTDDLESDYVDVDVGPEPDFIGAPPNTHGLNPYLGLGHRPRTLLRPPFVHRESTDVEFAQRHPPLAARRWGRVRALGLARGRAGTILRSLRGSFNRGAAAGVGWDGGEAGAPRRRSSSASPCLSRAACASSTPSSRRRTPVPTPTRTWMWRNGTWKCTRARTACSPRRRAAPARLARHPPPDHRAAARAHALALRVALLPVFVAAPARAHRLIGPTARAAGPLIVCAQRQHRHAAGHDASAHGGGGSAETGETTVVAHDPYSIPPAQLRPEFRPIHVLLPTFAPRLRAHAPSPGPFNFKSAPHDRPRASPPRARAPAGRAVDRRAVPHAGDPNPSLPAAARRRGFPTPLLRTRCVLSSELAQART